MRRRRSTSCAATTTTSSRAADSLDVLRRSGGSTDLGHEAEAGPFAFVHDPADAPPGGFALAGHLHPAIGIERRGAEAPVLLAERESQLVLPAFSVFTAGVRLRRAPGDRVHIIADGAVGLAGVRAEIRGNPPERTLKLCSHKHRYPAR